MERDPLQDIMLERAAQDRKWGVQNHSDLYWLGILTEEVGELAREIIEGHPERMRKELVQVGAVALAWLEAYERRADVPCEDCCMETACGTCRGPNGDPACPWSKEGKP